MSDESSPESTSRDDASLDRMMGILWMSVVVGILSLVIANIRGLWAAVGIGTLIFLASFAVGSFLGFLFGVPRTLSRDQATPLGPNNVQAPPVAANASPGAPPPPLPATGATGSKARVLQSNTNLEKISDWLTTLLVGAGLAEAHNINDALLMFREFLRTNAQVLVDEAGRPYAGALPTIGPIILVFGATLGFLYMYLNTRLVLVRLFYAIEDLLVGGKLPASEQRAVRAIQKSGGFGSFIEDQLKSKRTVTVEDALNLMFDLLYKSVPDQVIQLGQQLSNTIAANRPDYWFYMAAAFGQKLQKLESKSPEWVATRTNALDCARRAVALDPSYRNRLWFISDPDSNDDDLSSLRKDDEFLKIVGR